MTVIIIRKSNIFFVYLNESFKLFVFCSIFIVQVVLFKAVKQIIIIIENKKKYLYLADFSFLKIYNTFLVKRLNNTFEILLLIFFMSIHFTCSIYAVDMPLVREIIVNKKDSVFRHTFYYDENRNKVMENRYYTNNYSILPVSRTEWVYSENKCIIQRKQKWENGIWKTTNVINTQYNGVQKINELFIRVDKGIEKTEKNIVYNYDNGELESIRNFQVSQGDLQISQQIYFSYNENKQLIQQRINAGGNTLQTDTSVVIRYAYNPNGKPDSVVLMNSIHDTTINESLTMYFYDKVNGNITSQIQKKWNEKSLKWENDTKMEFHYDLDNRLIREIYAHYTILFWTLNTMYEHIYDANGSLSQRIMYKPIYRQWRKIYTIEYSEMENGRPNLMESKYNFWGGETGEFVQNFIPYYFNDEIAIMHADRMEIKYNLETTITTSSQYEKRLLKIYPNPSNGVFYISIEDSYVQSWEVFNLKGEIIKHNNNEYRTGVVDLMGLPDGLYMIKVITNDNKQLKQKIVINNTK